MRVGVNWAGGGAADAGFRRRRLSRRRRAGARRHPADHQIRLRLPAEHGGADRHRRRLSGHRSRSAGPTSPASRTSRCCASCCRCSSACPKFYLVPMPDDVPRHDHRLHRGDRHVPGARRHDRPQGRSRRTSSADLRADSLGTMIGAIFNTFPYVSYSQNIGLVGVTGVYSRWVCVAGGVIMLVLGLIPKLAFIVASVPQCVLGGAAASSCSAWWRRPASRSCPPWIMDAAQQRAGGRDLDRLRPDPDRRRRTSSTSFPMR